ncbi:PRC-barrel domain-containing protein [Christiangramia echinicola]|uniref:PRC-barrel domain-containing protein n=1 Tax=Christiangramia echinicola TaxID=279359 RepID=UPI000400141F|nr:PRC-barrel domain-containing protein [Christiangramia echinicola]
MSTREKHLYYLSELKDYKVNSKDSDIRGWEVKDLDNNILGKVDNLLVNKELGKVVYVDVEVEQSIINVNHDPYSNTSKAEYSEFINKEGENHIIIPIGLIDLNRDKKNVITHNINYETFAETKRYRSGSRITRDYEHHVLDSYDRRRERNEDPERENIKKTGSAYDHEETNERIRDESIRREKEQLKYTSEDRKRNVDNETSTKYKDESGNLKPERTLDEDLDWKKEERGMESEEHYDNRRRRELSDEEFYRRQEFNRRDLD